MQGWRDGGMQDAGCRDAGCRMQGCRDAGCRMQDAGMQDAGCRDASDLIWERCVVVKLIDRNNIVFFLTCLFFRVRKETFVNRLVILFHRGFQDGLVFHRWNRWPY
jgi:hypothetical protein